MTIEAPPTPTAKPNPIKRIGGVLIAPEPTLREITSRPDWLVPLIVILIVSLASAVLVAPRLDMETSLREQLEERGMSAAEIDQSIEMVTKFQKFTLPLTAVIVPLMLLIVAAALLLGFKMFGGEGTFKQAWSVTLYAWIPQLLKSIIATVLVVRMESLTIEQMQGMLKSNLGFLVDASEVPALYAFLSSLDLFNIWTVVLLVMGLAFAHRSSFAKSAAIVLTLWAIQILGKVGLAALQGLGAGS
jgi:hypothetical protein